MVNAALKSRAVGREVGLCRVGDKLGSRANPGQVHHWLGVNHVLSLELRIQHMIMMRWNSMSDILGAAVAALSVNIA